MGRAWTCLCAAQCQSRRRALRAAHGRNGGIAALMELALTAGRVSS